MAYVVLQISVLLLILIRILSVENYDYLEDIASEQIEIFKEKYEVSLKLVQTNLTDIIPHIIISDIYTLNPAHDKYDI